MSKFCLAITLLALSGPLLVAAVNYRYEFAVVFDGYAAAKDGVVIPSSGGPKVGAKFIRDEIANNGNPTASATDFQMDVFRDAALAFFFERYGASPVEPFLPDFEEPIMVSKDSMIVPMMMDESHSGRVSSFRRNSDLRYIPNGKVMIGGYYLVVGASGLPAKGTYVLPLEAGMSAGYGELIVDNVCPFARQLMVFSCSGSGGVVGNLRLTFQNDLPVVPTLDQGWNHDAQAPAQMWPMLMTVMQKEGKDSRVEWGTGSCTGIFYAAPKDGETFGIMSNLVCNFGETANYNGF
eukprot:gene1236-32580_t